MDSSPWPESSPIGRKKAIEKLEEGEIWKDKLHAMLCQPGMVDSDLESATGVVAEMMRVFSNTLSILNSYNEVRVNQTNDVRAARRLDDDDQKLIDFVVPVKSQRGSHKKRDDTWTEFKPTWIDEYAWRKYGQKTILNSKHQRSYYRCTHKVEQGCLATKQVQMSDEDPSMYKITYNGHHTCINYTNLQGASQIILEASSPMDHSKLINFETNKFMKSDDTCFRSMKHTPNEGTPSSGHQVYEQICSSDQHVPWDLPTGLSQVLLEPIPLIPYEVFPSTSIPGHEMDVDMRGSFGTFPI